MSRHARDIRSPRAVCKAHVRTRCAHNNAYVNLIMQLQFLTRQRGSVGGPSCRPSPQVRAGFQRLTLGFVVIVFARSHIGERSSQRCSRMASQDIYRPALPPTPSPHVVFIHRARRPSPTIRRSLPTQISLPPTGYPAVRPFRRGSRRRRPPVNKRQRAPLPVRRSDLQLHLNNLPCHIR